MVAADETTTVPVRLDYEAHAPVAYKALAHLDHAVMKQLEVSGSTRPCASSFASAPHS